ncbi:MAG: hypothetical protein IPL39_02690 [Opitutaceae bacterium]|nr:hypothetical protein [Opitutaceae bacterium]
MRTFVERLRFGSLLVATLAGLILGLMLAQCSAGEQVSSRVAWPSADSLGLNPAKK